MADGAADESAPLPPLVDTGYELPRRSGRKPAKMMDKESKSTTKPKPAKKRKASPKRREWNANNILTDHESPLATADIRAVLLSRGAWEALSSQDIREILAAFPDDRYILNADTDQARLDLKALENDLAFRSDCAAYTNYVADGQFDPDWLLSAFDAHERRNQGEFDGFLQRKFEDTWGTGGSEDLNSKGQASTILSTAPNSSQVKVKDDGGSDNGVGDIESCGAGASTKREREGTESPGQGQRHDCSTSGSLKTKTPPVPDDELGAPLRKRRMTRSQSRLASSPDELA